MKRMITLAAGGAIGYVLGARAGRERYDQIVDRASRMKNRDGEGGGISSLRTTAAEKASHLTDTARRKAHDTIDLVDAKVDTAADRVQETAEQATPGSSSASTGGSAGPAS